MEDVFTERRAHMVDGQLRTTDVTDHAILQAFLEVPREAFVPAAMRELAYMDEDIRVTPAGVRPIRFVMEPSPLARLLQLAEIRGHDLVLDIGCATGYSSAIISRIAGSVIAVESDSDLIETASATLVDLGYDNIAVVEGALEDGLESEAPYDVILIGGAVDAVPEKLFAQLKDGGRLVTVLGTGNAARAHVYLKQNGVVSGRAAFNAAVKPLPGFQREATFHF